MRRRLEQAGFPKANPRNYWMICGIAAAAAGGVAVLTHQAPLVIALAVFVVGLGLPRWVLGFLTNRRKKKFTANFATAIDVIVRSVRSGLPTSEALRIVAREIPDPVGSEFHNLVESLKVGVTLDQGLKRMMESMPTAEVGFFAIVMTIQAKSGGNLSEPWEPRAVLRQKTPARQDQGDVVGSQGIRHDHRFSAARRDGHRLSHHARLHFQAVHRARRQPDAGGLRVLDGHGHHGDAQNDQL